MKPSLFPARCLAVVVLATWAFAPALAQHDSGRNAVRVLARGQFEKGVEMVEGKPGRIGAAEALYVQVLAKCLQDDAQAAFRLAQQAVKEGLPFERLQAGPRDALAPLYEHKGYQTWAKGQQKPLLHGPLLGTVTDNSARFWVRTAETASVQVHVTPAVSSSPTKPLVAEAKTSAASDYTAVVEVAGLQGDTRYKYSVDVGDAANVAAAEFRTHPPSGTSAKFSVAFGGGAGFVPKFEGMWETLAAHNLHAMLMLGDNVYIDDPTHPLTQHYCYYRRQSRPEWRRLTATTPIYAIYDDHDFGTNDCVPGPHIDNPPWKPQVLSVFRQNWANPAYGGGSEQPGCWFDFHIGDVHFILVDGRYYRDLKGGSMLGPVQKKWLLQTLKNSIGTFKVVVSPVPWSPGVKPGSRDTWDGFDRERQDIFSFLADNEISGVILMAADRHRSDLRKIPRDGAYDLYEVESSRLTNVHTHGLVQNAKGSEFILGYNKTCCFGQLDFDTTKDDPQVTYRIFTIDDEQVHSHTLKLSQLK